MRPGLPLAGATVCCAKPDCGLRAAIHRHHKAHEALWLGPWAHRASEPRWQEFVARYHEFREADIVRLCAPHHAEIHARYDRVISDDVARVGLPLYLYSWAQAERLMDKLRSACEAWLLRETPGIDSDEYGRTKALRRRILKRKAAAKADPDSALGKRRRRRHRRKKRGA
jgi:hypothetical protein